MWKNMTWLAEEWCYWFEWRKMALAARLEGKDELPPRNSPFWYTFQWIGVAVAFPFTVLGVLGAVGYLISSYEAALKVAIGVAVALAVIGWVVWIFYSCIEMEDKGPDHNVVSKWKREHTKKP